MPIAVLPTVDTPITEEVLTGMPVHVRVRDPFMGAEEIEAWLERFLLALAELDYLRMEKPPIAILTEYGPRWSASITGDMVIRRFPNRPNSFVLLCRRLCPADILHDERIDGPFNKAFQKVLKPHGDPNKRCSGVAKS